MSSNPFSKKIPFRKGNPMHLLDYMCAVVGSYRRGKSYFANTLLGRHDGFKLGSSVNGCTKGIDIWDTPFYHKDKLIIDCEGIDDPNQEVPWANKLFILCLAISSTLIYNINGIVGRDDIEKLFLMTKIASHIQPPNEYQFLPNLVVLLRDFQLDSPPDFVEYFLDRLSKVDHNGVRQDAMRNMSTIETDQLDPIFVEKIEEAVTNIFEDLPPKYLNASEMTGVTFAEFLERCVEQINDPTNTMLSIPSAYEATINYAAQKAYETCLELYNEMMDQINIKGLPISWDEFESVHNTAFEEALKNFIQQIIGSADQIQSFQKIFHDKITALKDQFYMKNSTALSKYHEEWAYKLWEEKVAPGLEIENLFDTDKFEEAIESFEQSYRTIVIPGEEAVKNQLEEKVKSMEECLRNQEQQSKQAIDQLKDENERQLYEQRMHNQHAIDQQKIQYEQMLNQIRQENQTRIDNLQTLLIKATETKTSFWDKISGVVGGVLGGLTGGLVRRFIK
ncbi:5651_t:CDS:2 [Gigaspora rosea]|nr:5651_t:CDS:2 [Gigaspora rosea]